MRIEEKLREIETSNPNKKICIVIGDPVEHSLSPVIHSAGYKSIGLDNQFVFEKMNVAKGELEEFVNTARKFKSIVGITCTMPHKQSIIKYLDENKAQIINAVNTVLCCNGKYTGYNTDWYGIEAPFADRKINLDGKKVAIVGAGGASRAALYTFKKHNCSISILNRTKEKADLLAKEFDCQAFALNNEEAIESAEIIVNATSVGMGEATNLSPIDISLISKNHIVFECIYKPKETLLVQAAKMVGSEVIYGWEMLLYQGILQFEIYTGRRPIMEIMKNVL